MQGNFDARFLEKIREEQNKQFAFAMAPQGSVAFMIGLSSPQIPILINWS